VSNYKVYPTTDHEDPEEVWRQSSTLSLTSAPDEVEVNATPTEKDPVHLLCRKLSGLPGRSGRVKKISPAHRGSMPGPSSQ